MGKTNPDEMILSYNDVVLRRSDLDILSGPYFLNDRIIEFYFSYIMSSCSEEILLIPPSISFWIMNCPAGEGLKEFLEPFHFHDKKLVIFPVNDNDDVGRAEGGSHWSLLAFERNANVFVHYDSSGGMNKRHAKRLYNAVVGFMSIPSSATNPITYEERSDSPQQLNGYDCGLYVLAIARVICSWSASKHKGGGDSMWFSDVKEQVTPAVVAGMRNEILELFRGLMPIK